MPSPIRRFLVVPDQAWDNATLVRAQATSALTRQEAGIQVAQPERSATTPPGGDIGLTLSGEPEVHVEGVASITRGGVVEDARFAWVRDGDDATTDLQFRQSPHVVGRRPDLLKYSHEDPAAESDRSVRPRLLSLVSGDALCVWTERKWSPIWARDANTFGSGVTIYVSKLDHATDTWSTPDNAVVPADIHGTAKYISAVDVTQYPDTAEIIMCVATADDMDPAIVTRRALWVFASTDDGATWVLRHRLYFDGTIPDIILDSDGDGDVDDLTPVQDWALELLDSGRMCLFMLTETKTWSLTSDDRGASWAVGLVASHIAASQYAGHGCGATKARNGMAVFTRSLRVTTSFGANNTDLYFTRDGVTFGAKIVLDYGNGFTPYLETCDSTACISPDGWVHIYGTEHAAVQPGGGNPTVQDWIWGRRLKTRDPLLSDGATDILPYVVSGGNTTLAPIAAFHLGSGTPAGNYSTTAEDPNPCVYGGFVGIDAILHRGQVLMAVTAVQEGTQPVTLVQADLLSSGLIVYRLNHWQPIQERLGNLLQSTFYAPSRPAMGRAYNRTWDCYGLPQDWGWAGTGAVTESIVEAGAEGGYLAVPGSPRYWDDASLPTSAATVTLDAALRIVMHAETGGTVSADEIVCRLQVANASGNHTDISIRFERSGDDVKVRVYDNIGAATVGTDATVVGTGWIEVLFAQLQLAVDEYSVSAYVRPYPRSTDPDWDEPYVEITSGEVLATSASANELLRFGHPASGARESWWKAIHLHRGNSTGECRLVQWGTTYTDDDATNDLAPSGTGEPPLDNGLDNWMRTCRTLATPPMFISRGVHARFRGEATTSGEWDHATGYAYAGGNVAIQPVLREWRSVDDDVEIELVFEAPTADGFRPDSIAVLGHNCAGYTIQFNDTDSWGAPSVEFDLSIPSITGAATDRFIHEWAWSASTPGAIFFASSENRVQCVGASPWRQSQFKSDPGGQRHYLMLRKSAEAHTNVFRILDNTSNTLILATDVTTAGITLNDKSVWHVAVVSDRFAVMIGHHFEDPSSVLETYEFCRVLIRKTKHWDADEAFARIGRIVFGTAVEISTPEFERGWSVGFESGSTIVQQQTGAAYSHRQRPILRTWQADRPWMMPPAEAGAVFSSPAVQDARASWAQWLDVSRRIEGGGTACVLVWDGDRFVGFNLEEQVQCAADPMGLAMCHVVGLGELTNLAFDGRVVNLPSGATCAPRPVAQIRALQFSETL